ncbi:hypothetical protein AB0M61_35840 [Streptomyces sp. NPDC051642]|uniref:hypothetical protein n=1 Tax=Streptomyces sp. NPDC051642 TaxID=3154646 RepID=UPI003418EBCF
MQFAYHSHDRDEAPAIVGGVPNTGDPMADQFISLANEVVTGLGDGNRPVRFHEVSLVPDEDTAPGRADALLRNYQSVGGNLVSVFESPDDGGTFVFCFGCQTRQDRSFGWQEKSYADANDHAAACRAGTVVRNVGA